MKSLTGKPLSLHCPKWLNGSRRNVLLLIALLLGSFIFKLGLMELGVIVADPARDLAVALGIVDGVKYPLEGPLLGEHLHSGPLYFYVLAVPFFVSEHILSVMVLISLIQAIGILYCYLWGRFFFSERVGLTLALLMSVDINSNFTIWAINNTNFIFPLGVGFSYYLSKAILNKESRALLIATVLFAIAIQFHPLFLIFSPFILYAFGLRIPRRKSILVASLIILIIIMSPWIYHQLRDGLPFIREIVGFSRGEMLGVISIFHTLKIIPELMFKQVIWNPWIFWGLSQGVPSPIKYLAVVLLGLCSLLSLFGVIVILKKEIKRAKAKVILIFAFILTVWLTIPFLRNFTAWYYFTPVHFMWMGLASYGLCYIFGKCRNLNWCNLLYGVMVTGVLITGFSYYQVLKYFRDQGAFTAPRNVLMSIIDLQKPFSLGDKRMEFLSLGLFEEDQVAKWAAEKYDSSSFHGAILYELSISRNSLFNRYRKEMRNQIQSNKADHYVGLLKKDLVKYSYKPTVTLQIGAMAILKSVPQIDYSKVRLSYKEHENWFKEEFDDHQWQLLRLPVYTSHDPVEYPPVMKTYWNNEVIFVRMNLLLDLNDQKIFLGVGFPNYDPFEYSESLEAIYVNGVEIGKSEFHSTAYGWILPVSVYVRRGENLLALKLRVNKTSDLDIYTW